MITRFFWAVLGLSIICNESNATSNEPSDPQQIRLLALKGNAQAFSVLGCLYECGILVTQDWKTSMLYYEQAATLHAPDAQFNLGALLLEHRTNEIPAVNWLRSSAAKGVVGAQICLGLVCHEGKLVERNFPEALRLFEAAAGKNDKSAQLSVEKMYLDGEGTARNKPEAKNWSDKARTNTISRFPKLPSNDEVHLFGYPKEFKRDYSKVIEWFLPTAIYGDSRAALALGRLYFQSDGVPTDKKEALKWFEKAANQKNPEAMFYLALLYSGGFKPVEANLPEARRLIRAAAELGHPDSQAELGRMYESGEGVPVDLGEALKWYYKAATAGAAGAKAKYEQLSRKPLAHK